MIKTITETKIVIDGEDAGILGEICRLIRDQIDEPERFVRVTPLDSARFTLFIRSLLGND